MARFTLPVFVLSGAVIGTAIGVKFFGDDALRRLQRQHTTDRANNVEGQRYQLWNQDLYLNSNENNTINFIIQYNSLALIFFLTLASVWLKKTRPFL